MYPLLKYIGGSQLYGLATETSDVDIRGVYVDTSPSNIFGVFPTKLQPEALSDFYEGENDDVVVYELRQYAQMIYKSNNIQITESLWLPDHKIQVGSRFHINLMEQRNELLSTEIMLTATRGFAYSEFSTVFNRSHKAGKRNKFIDQYGYNYKAVVHLLRICESVIYFQRNGIFPTDFMEHCPSVAKIIIDIKNEPAKFSVTEIKNLCERAREDLHEQPDKLGYKMNKGLLSELVITEYKKHI